MVYEWDFSFALKYWPLFLTGLWRTIELASLSVVIGFSLGIVVVACRLSKNRVLRCLAIGFVEIFRNIPSLILLFWLFYLVPVLTGIQNKPFLAALIAFSAYSAAFSSEIYRSGIESIDKGQVEAGRAIGFDQFRIMRFILIPQAIRRVIPSLTNEVIDVVKTTALASTIAYPELLYQAKLLSEVEYKPLEAYTIAAALFIGLLIFLSFLSVLIERRLKTN
jgi:polar amino acid transport system permease protein